MESCQHKHEKCPASYHHGTASPVVGSVSHSNVNMAVHDEHGLTIFTASGRSVDTSILEP